MPDPVDRKPLKKELGLFQVYAIATGATLSSGFFLLPGLAAAHAGPAVTLSYLIAAIHLIPAVFCMAELSTAMPRAGGIYYFLDRSLGPLFGTIGGFGTWITLILKTAFALLGMGAYVSIFFPKANLVPMAVGLTLFFGFVNGFGSKKTGTFQVLLVAGVLAILSVFLGIGSLHINPSHFDSFLGKGFDSIYATAGLVYISFIGITNIASVSEEVKNPEKTLPLAMLLALATAIILYGVGITVMVGVLPPHEFYNDLTPVTSTAQRLLGSKGAVIMTIAAVLAFFSVSNAAILSASRYLFAMSRDQLIPSCWGKLNRYGVPKNSIALTVVLIILSLLFLDVVKIAKLASAFQLLLFALCCLAVVIMRESKIESYDPGFHSPFYPWMHIFGVIAPLCLIGEMGWLPILFTGIVVAIGTVWYFNYGIEKVDRYGAIYHIFARLGERRFEGLDRELREILIEKGLREEDPFDVVIAQAGFIDIETRSSFEEVVEKAAEKLAQKTSLSADILIKNFMKSARSGVTPISHGISMPHMRSGEISHSSMVLVRAKEGLNIVVGEDEEGGSKEEKTVYAIFFLVSSEQNPGQHLRILAQIAGHASDENFMPRWQRAKNEQELKEVLLRDECFMSIIIDRKLKSAALVDRTVSDLTMPAQTLIALIHRRGKIIIPRGNTVLRAGDRMTVIGDPSDIQKLHKQYSDEG